LIRSLIGRGLVKSSGVPFTGATSPVGISDSSTAVSVPSTRRPAD